MEDMAFLLFRFICSFEGADFPIASRLLRTGTGGIALGTTVITGKAFGYTKYALRGTFHAAERSRVLYRDNGNWGSFPKQRTSRTIGLLSTVSLFTRITTSVVDSNNVRFHFLERLEFRTEMI